MSNTSPLKTAFFSALLVLAVAYPVLGLKLTTVGIKLEVHGASPTVLWSIAGAAVLMFVWQLLRSRLDGLWAKLPELPKVPGAASNFLTLPSTQRWIILGLVMVGLVWPFFASRGSVDIVTLILIYVMLGLGLNIVVGLAGLLDLGYVGFYAVGAYSYALLSHYYGHHAIHRKALPCHQRHLNIARQRRHLQPIGAAIGVIDRMVAQAARIQRIGFDKIRRDMVDVVAVKTGIARKADLQILQGAGMAGNAVGTVADHRRPAAKSIQPQRLGHASAHHTQVGVPAQQAPPANPQPHIQRPHGHGPCRSPHP